MADIGCGPGYFTLPLAKLLINGKIIALDTSDEMIEACQGRLEESRLGNFEVLKCGEYDFPVAPASVDGLFIAFVVHHPSDRERFLTAAKEMLKAGGWCFILEWHKKEKIMAITSAICSSFKQELLQGKHNFASSGGHTFKLALFTSSASLDATTTDYSTSNEITEYFKVVLKAMSFVYPELAEKTEHIGHGTVRLTSGKMSSRTGKVITAIDFIDEIAEAVEAKMKESGVAEIDHTLTRDIAIGAIKYATLRSNILQDSVFDKEKALSFEGDSGPYLQYTHARICSVLKKAKREGIKANIKNVLETPYEVERILYQFPEVIEEATEERAPHKVVGYLTELAGEFNTFYAQEKIADQDDEFAPYKVAIADAVRVTLKNGLWVLGIKAPERM
ncbi:MAG: arginine--tRNA ligase [Chloroflexi bacterium]|nr:arginine--tRNA ligase [Chloroflexota bacterium]